MTISADGAAWPTMARKELRMFIDQHLWTYARTMPQCPHEYLLLWKAKSEADFLRFVMTVRQFGYDQDYFGKRHRYLDVAGWRYWTMGAQMEATWVLNRAKNADVDNPILPSSVPFTPWIWSPTPQDPWPPKLRARHHLSNESDKIV